MVPSFDTGHVLCVWVLSITLSTDTPVGSEPVLGHQPPSNIFQYHPEPCFYSPRLCCKSSFGLLLDTTHQFHLPIFVKCERQTANKHKRRWGEEEVEVQSFIWTHYGWNVKEPTALCVSLVKESDLLCAQAWRDMQIGINVEITVTEKLNDA